MKMGILPPFIIVWNNFSNMYTMKISLSHDVLSRSEFDKHLVFTELVTLHNDIHYNIAKNSKIMTFSRKNAILSNFNVINMSCDKYVV